MNMPKIAVKLRLAGHNKFPNVDFRDSAHKEALDYGESLASKSDGKTLLLPKNMSEQPMIDIDIDWENLTQDTITVKVQDNKAKRDNALKIFGKYMANETIFNKYEINNSLFEVIENE
jgi:hypothetical protein